MRGSKRSRGCKRSREPSGAVRRRAKPIRIHFGSSPPNEGAGIMKFKAGVPSDAVPRDLLRRRGKVFQYPSAFQ